MTNIDVLLCVHSKDSEHDLMLKDAFESLIQQTYSDFRVVVIMDECWEYTRFIVEDYSRSLDIKFYERPVKQGLAMAKNFGLSKCTADWVAYLDADDQWMTCKLEIQAEYLNNHPDVSFCFTEAWDNYGGFLLRPNCFRIGQYETHEQIAAALPTQNVLCHGSALIRRSALEILGGYNTSKLFLGREDWELWQRAIAAGYQFYKIPERLYIYSMGTSVPR